MSQFLFRVGVADRFNCVPSIFQAHLEKTEHDIRELSQNAVNLKSNYLELTELQHVLEKTRGFFTEVS